MPTSPTVARWELLLRINGRIKDQKIDVPTATAALKISANHWWQLMNDRRALTEDHFEAILKLLGIKHATTEDRALRALRVQSRERGWWTEYTGLIDDENRRLIGLEHGAQSIRSYEALLIPGLLQTEEYIRAIMVADIARVRPVDASLFIEARLRRQQLLHGDDPLQVTAVLNEAALVQQTGGPDILRGQLTYLSTLIREKPETIDIRIVPFTASNRPILSGSPFHLIDFASPVLPTVAWHESVATRGIIEDPSRVRELRIIYENQLEAALDKQASLDLIERSAERLA